MKHSTYLSAVFLSLGAFQAQAQVVVLDKQAMGYGTDVWFSRVYDTSSVMTFLAKVERVIETGPTSKDGAVAISFVVRPYTRQDIGGGRVRDIFQAPITVEIGPSWFVRGQTTKVKAGDYVSVTGSRIDHGNGAIIVAEMVKRNKNILGLRRPGGEPFWMVAIDADNAASRLSGDNAAILAQQRTDAEIAAAANQSGQQFPALYPGRVQSTNVYTYGPADFRFGNVLIYNGWSWNSGYPYWYFVGPGW